MTIILSKLRHYRLPALRGASSGAVPLGGAGSGSLRPRLVTGPVGVVTSLFPSLENGEAEGASRNPAVERREARRPDRKGRKDASPASSRASPARKVPRGTCVSRCSTPPRSPNRGQRTDSPGGPLSSVLRSAKTSLSPFQGEVIAARLCARWP